MISDEFKALITEYNFKKNILDNHTSEIANGIKEWCIKEFARIKSEQKSLVDFFNDNKNIVTEPNFTFHSWTDGTFYWEGCHLKIGGKCSSGVDKNTTKTVPFNYVNAQKKPGVGSRNYSCYGVRFDDLANDEHTSIDYWIDVKNQVLNFKDVLDETITQVKNFLETIILIQKKRCDDMMQAVRDIGIDVDNITQKAK